ncbi:MAG: YfhO family protein, partial [Chloroflexi bacterium]|nr:YfhO family protein [Chloroflexota bacterium]
TPSELLSPNVAPDLAGVNPYIPFNLGPVLVALGIVGIVLAPLVRARGEETAPRSLHFFFALSALACALMTLSLSTWLWEHLPLLVLAEFPWRFVGIAAIPMAMLVGIASSELREAISLLDGGQRTEDDSQSIRRPSSVVRRRSSVGSIVTLLIVLDCFVYLFPRTPFIVHGNPTLADIAKFERDAGALGTTSASEYLPLWTARRMYDSPLTPALLDNRVPDHLQRETLPVTVRVETLAQNLNREAYRFTSVGALSVHLRRIYFPGWTATIDGQSAPLDLAAPNGTMRVQMPAGEHTVEFAFGETRLRLIADGVSLITAVLLVGVAVRLRRPLPHASVVRGPSSAVTQPSFLTVAFALVAFYFVAPHLGYVRYSHLPQIEGV